MKKLLVALFVILSVSLALAQGPGSLKGVPTAPSGSVDVLGAHLGYGRGCLMCHMPHSGPGGNGYAALNAKDATAGNMALWGEDLSPLYGQTFNFGDAGKFPVTIYANGAAADTAGPHDPTNVVMFCLSCHDGNLATGGHMKGQTVESVPIFGGTAPTLLGNDGTVAGNYNNDHPVGPSAIVGCGGPYDWDCTITAGKISMNGAASSVFASTNYDFGVSFSVVGGNPTVTCTSCHDQHSMNIYKSSNKNFYQTAFFLRGYYNPSTGGNNAAQFCRQCHGGESNEMKGQTSVPTT